MPHTRDQHREIIDNFAVEIKAAAISGTKPEKAVINFRNEKAEKFERDIFSVPISLLRFRKENGRIASDVLSYEKEHGLLKEDDPEDQKILAQFLQDKDPDKTEDLEKSIKQEGQEEPAIITCDGFLINGNRRRLVFQTLWEKHHDSKFERMRVVILPGKGDPGGPPTNREIELIENRYQFFRDGKSEYSNFDRALSFRRKEEFGISLEEQLKDDPVNADLSEKDFKKIVKRYREEFLKPLECADDYLEFIGKPGVYKLISSSVHGKENRWQAFIDYYNFVRKKLDNPQERIKLGIEEDEVGRVQELAFNLIRLREFPDIRTKLHELMRDLPDYLKNTHAKQELYKIRPTKVSPEESEEADLNPDEVDKTWIKENRTDIVRQVVKAKELLDRRDDQEKPLDLLQQAFSKLHHEKMQPSEIGTQNLPEAMSMAEQIRDRAEELRKTFYQHQKSTDDFLKKHGRSGK